MMKGKRAGALMLAVMLIAALFVSSVFAAHEAGHECSGDGCGVCRLLALNAHLLRLFALAFLAMSAHTCIVTAKARAHRRGDGRRIPVLTPVRWKVRLND